MSISIRLDPDIIARLEHLAEATGRSKAFYIREAIEAHLDDLEGIYLAERELENLRAGRSSARPLAAILKDHGVQD